MKRQNSQRMMVMTEARVADESNMVHLNSLKLKEEETLPVSA